MFVFIVQDVPPGLFDVFFARISPSTDTLDLFNLLPRIGHSVVCNITGFRMAPDV
jgi:hypothetical protein